MIFNEFYFHSKNLNIMKLLDVEAHLVNLFEAVFFLVLTNEFFFRSKLAEVIVDCTCDIIRVYWGKKVDNYWRSATKRCLSICLNTVNSLPEIAVCSFGEDFIEPVISYHLNMIMRILCSFFIFFSIIPYNSKVNKCYFIFVSLSCLALIRI